MVIQLTLSFRSVGGHCIENVYEDKKNSDKQSHSARDDIRWDNEADPRDDNKQTCKQTLSLAIKLIKIVSPEGR